MKDKHELNIVVDSISGHVVGLSGKPRAKLTRKSDSHPVPGLLVRFTLDGTDKPICSTLTNQEGVAECDSGMQLNLVADLFGLVSGYHAHFDGTDKYESASGGASIGVAP